MEYISKYKSPLGDITMTGDEKGLTGLLFDGQKYFQMHLERGYTEREISLFVDVRRWLDIYFSGKKPDFVPPLHLTGSLFQNQVWEILSAIPYGETMTYGEVARIVAKKRGIPRMSAQAVGGAVGKNRISVVVPCHRVVGADGSLTGYAGGIARKKALLEREGAYREFFFVPKHSTAP